jgi:hypothetical protein
VAGLTLVILTTAILPCLALFLLCLRVETRIDQKQAQLMLASAIHDRNAMIENIPMLSIENARSSVDSLNRYETHLDNFSGVYYKTQFEWLAPHAAPTGRETFAAWFSDLVYWLHHAYNAHGAESLAVIADRQYEGSLSSGPKTGLPQDWQWSTVGLDEELRVHGVANQVDGRVWTSLRTYPLWKEIAAGIAICAIATVCIGILIAIVTRKFFLNVAEPPLPVSRGELLKMAASSSRLLILIPSWAVWRHLSPRRTLDIASLASDAQWGETFDSGGLKGSGTLVLEHFDFQMTDPACTAQKLALLRRLEATGRRVAIVSTIDTLQFLSPAAAGSAAGATYPLYSFEPVDYEGWRPAGKRGRAPLPAAIGDECGPTPELRRIGEHLARSIAVDRLTATEEIVQEILDRAAGHYRSLWNLCTDDERFALMQLAEDGMANPMNRSALRQLIRKGLVVKDPRYRLMNESFRRFVTAAPAREESIRWSEESAQEGWGRVRGGFVVGVVLVAAFLFATQQEFLQTWTGYLTAALGGMGTIFRLLNVVRSKTNAAKSA